MKQLSISKPFQDSEYLDKSQLENCLMDSKKMYYYLFISRKKLLEYLNIPLNKPLLSKYLTILQPKINNWNKEIKLHYKFNRKLTINLDFNFFLLLIYDH